MDSTGLCEGPRMGSIPSRPAEEIEMEERERFFKGWMALREACRNSHKSGPGAAAICICGAACGGSAACSMLGGIKSLITYMPIENLPAEWRQKIELLRKFV